MCNDLRPQSQRGWLAAHARSRVTACTEDREQSRHRSATTDLISVGPFFRDVIVCLYLYYILNFFFFSFRNCCYFTNLCAKLIFGAFKFSCLRMGTFKWLKFWLCAFFLESVGCGTCQPFAFSWIEVVFNFRHCSKSYMPFWF